MSRTRKGSRGPGWEPWSNRNERQKPAPDYPAEEESAMFVTPQEVLMSREIEYPLTAECKKNLDILLTSLNKLRAYWGKPLHVTSGYRPGKYNVKAGGAKNSSHLTCEACDFADTDGSLDKWLSENPHILEECGLYLEFPANTVGWTHVQTRKPASGARIFHP